MLQRALTRTPLPVLAAAALALVAAGLAASAVLGAALLPARTGPPVEALTVERTVLAPGSIRLTVRNTGPDPVTVAQAVVNDSFADVTGGAEPIGRLRSVDLVVSYPWQEGLPYHVGLLTSTGLVIEHEVEAAVRTPEVGPSSLSRMVALGAMIGVVPVLLGITALPVLRRMGPAGTRGLLALTVGLLGFLAADAAIEGFDVAAGTGGAFGGPVLVVLGAALSYLLLGGADRMLRRGTGRYRLAVLVAVGIGLHNLGEGLAVGSAFAVGELALGMALVVGFAIHNTTEGIAVVAPLTRAAVTPARLLGLGLVAGSPAMVGTVLGSTVTTPATAALLLGVGVGAIVGVVAQIAPLLRPATDRFLDVPVLAGLAGGVLVMYLTGLLVVA